MEPAIDYGIVRIGIDHVAAGAAVQRVIAGAAIQYVITGVTLEDVITPTAENHVVARPAVEHVCVGKTGVAVLVIIVRVRGVRATVDLVVAATTHYGVIPEVARQDVAMSRTGQVFDIGNGCLGHFFIIIGIIYSFRQVPGIAFGVAVHGLAAVQAHRDAHHGHAVGGGVTTGATGQHVGAVAAFQRVVAGAAVQVIVAGAAVQHVIPTAAVQFVVAAQAPQFVHCVAAGQHVVIHGPAYVLDLVSAHADDRIAVGVAAAGRAVAQVDSHAQRGIRVVYGVITGAALEGVRARAAHQQVIIRAAVQRVVTGHAVQRVITAAAVELVIDSAAFEFVIAGDVFVCVSSGGVVRNTVGARFCVPGNRVHHHACHRQRVRT